LLSLFVLPVHLPAAAAAAFRSGFGYQAMAACPAAIPSLRLIYAATLAAVAASACVGLVDTGYACGSLHPKLNLLAASHSMMCQ